MPVLLVIYDLLLAGVQLHFSGHWYIEGVQLHFSGHWYIEGDPHQGLFQNKAVRIHLTPVEV